MTKTQLRLSWAIVGVIVLIRFAFTGIMGMMPQDAYYDFYAAHPAISYYDHPPGIAILLRGFTDLLGKTAFAVKLADTVCTLVTIWAFFKLSGRFLDSQKIQTAMLLFLSTLMVTILSLISTPDVPMLLFWTLTLIQLYEAIIQEKWISWIWAGLLAGCCFDSKYTAVLLIAGTFLFLILSGRHRKWLWTGWPALFLILFCAVASPVYIWNKQNNFASFRFQSESRMSEMGGIHISLSDFLGVVGHQSAILMPILFFFLIISVWKGLRYYRFRILTVPDSQLFLLCFFLPAFLGFFGLSFFYWVKLNWMMPAYITGIIWVARYIGPKWLRAQLVFSLIVHLCLAAEVLFYIVPIRSDDTWFGWPEMAAQVNAVRKNYPEAFIFSADDYKTSAMLNFYLPEMVYSKNVVGERALQFDFVGTDLSTLAGKDAIFIDSNPRFDSLGGNAEPPAFYHQFFRDIRRLAPILIGKNGKPVRKFSLFLCSDYRPPAGAPGRPTGK